MLIYLRNYSRRFNLILTIETFQHPMYLNSEVKIESGNEQLRIQRKNGTSYKIFHLKKQEVYLNFNLKNQYVTKH